MLQCSSPLPALDQDLSVVLGSSVLSDFHLGFQEDRGEEAITALNGLCQLQVINSLKLSKSFLATLICCYLDFQTPLFAVSPSFFMYTFNVFFC